MENQHTGNLSDKEVRLDLYLRVIKAGKNINSLEEKIEHYKNKYKCIGFEVSELEFLFNDFIHHLETEIQEETEFINHVYEQYCTNASKSPEIKELSKECS